MMRWRRLEGAAAGLLLLAAHARAGSDEDLVELGRRLFMDPAASRSGRFSCASCHDPEHGFSDPRRLSIDEGGPTLRHSQPLLDLRADAEAHWDGEFGGVRGVIFARVADAALGYVPASRDRRAEVCSPAVICHADGPAPVGPPGRGALVQRLAHKGFYREGFARAFGNASVTEERVMDALEAYLLTLRSGASPYDRGALSPSATRGLELFRGKANCASCHPIHGPGSARFTDRLYHNTGVAFADVGGAAGGASRRMPADPGRGAVTRDPTDVGRFRTPSLRNVAVRPPYMHDGSLPTLEAVVRYYDRGGTLNPGLDAGIAPLRLAEGEIADLVAFLCSLTSDVRPGLGPKRRTPLPPTHLTIQDLYGVPIQGLEVRITPAGDRLEGAPAEATPLRRTTDAQGHCSFPFPEWTHVRVEASGLELGEGRLLPDFAKRHRLSATSRCQVSLRVVSGGSRRPLPRTLTAVGPDPRDRRPIALFDRVRTLPDGEAIYVARWNPADGAIPRARGTVAVFLDGLSHGMVPIPLDLSGGASPTIWLN